MSEPQKSSVSGSLSLIALSKTLMLIRKTFAKPSESAFLTTESFDLSNRNDLKLFNFLLKKPLKTKQEEQIVFTTLKAFPFFEKLDPLVSSSLLQNFSDYFEYTSNPSGSTIYQTGDEGDFFYIILSGSIFVLISKSGLMPAEFKVESPKRESSPDSPQSFKLFTDVVEKIEKVEELSLDRYKKKLKIGRNQSFLFKTSGFELLSQEIERRSPTKRNEYMIQRINKIINYKYPEYFIAHELKAGESFGEVALITNSKRNEICICKEICHFLKISKNNYKKIMMLSHAKDLKELIVFFKNFNIFSHWPRAQLSTFIKFFQTNVFTNNDVLYKENDESNFLYFIKEGEVEVIFFLI